MQVQTNAGLAGVQRDALMKQLEWNSMLGASGKRRKTRYENHCHCMHESGQPIGFEMNAGFRIADALDQADAFQHFCQIAEILRA